MKKITVFILLAISTILSVCFLFSCGDNGLQYVLNADGESYSVAGFKEDVKDFPTEITVKAEYKGKPVTLIKSNAFKDNDTIVKVTIPDSVTEIGKKAFYNATALETVEISTDAVLFINEFAFSGCKALKNVSLGGTRAIRSLVFENCTNLESITIPKYVKAIYMWAFKGCESLSYMEFEINSGWKNSENAGSAFKHYHNAPALTNPETNPSHFKDYTGKTFCGAPELSDDGYVYSIEQYWYLGTKGEW